jgi:ATP-binding cassette, subfamily B, bacterial MsbA
MTETGSSREKSYRFLLRLRPRVQPYRSSFLWAALLIVAGTIIGLAFPLVVRELLDAAFLAGDRGMLNRIALFLIASSSSRRWSTSVRAISRPRFPNGWWRTCARTSSGTWSQPPGFFDQRRVGELSSRLASDAGLIQGILRFGVPELVRQGLFLVGALILVTITHPRLTLVTLIAIRPRSWWGGFGRRVRRISAPASRTAWPVAVARAEQVFTQIRVVQSFTRERWEAERFGEVDATRDEGLRRAVARALLTGR